MEDKITQEHLENSAGPPPADTPIDQEHSETPTESETVLPIPQEAQAAPNMEVHHHAHHDHGKRNWKSYFWEFLMLFLAVFCGFLAEYQLEQTIERHREKEFIISMMEDAAADTAMIHEIIPANIYRIAYADSQAVACMNYKGTQAEDSRIYGLHRNYVYRPDLVYPTDRTLFQLKNSGGMRLIRNKKAAASINAYDSRGKRVINQQGYYEEYLTQVTAASSALLNFTELHKERYRSSARFDSAKLIYPDQKKLLALANKSIMFKGVLQMYVVRLEEMEKEAVNLMQTLRKEYDLE
jgi:hypothetical protein